MKVLITAATELEIPSFVNSDNYPGDVLITGVGTPMTMYHLQKHLSAHSYDLVIQAGIAGAFRNLYEPAKTVIVVQDTFGDMGFEENNLFTPLFKTSLMDKNAFPFENGWLINKNNLLDGLALKKVTAITVNKITDNDNMNKDTLELFNTEIETMEGAALHYICLQERIQFLQIRSISNYVGDRNKLNWKIPEAIQSLDIELKKLINQLS